MISLKIIDHEIKKIEYDLKKLEEISRKRKLFDEEIKYKNQLKGALFELYNVKDYIKIVCINYDNGMNYSIDCWTKNEKIQAEE